MNKIIALNQQEINFVGGALADELCNSQAASNTTDNARETIRTVFAGIGGVIVTFLGMYYIWYGINKCTNSLAGKKSHSMTCSGCMRNTLNVIMHPKKMLQSQLTEDNSLV